MQATARVARSRASCNPTAPAVLIPPNFQSHELPDVLSGWRAGRIGEPCDLTASSAWLWGFRAASGTSVH